VLCLQTNRLEYKDNELFKHRHKVQIEKKLFVDRFLIKNKEMSETIQNHVMSLRE
jgi:hypothetical protein